jgi:DNA-binding MarR family transcriptional regulator
VIAGRDGIRPSEIADLQLVHPSLVTRQVRELEDAGYVQVSGDPADGRSWLVALTPAGRDEMRRLQQVGLDRFALFVADWEPGEVQALAALLDKLRTSMAAVGEREQRPAARRERPRAADRRRRAERHEDIAEHPPCRPLDGLQGGEFCHAGRPNAHQFIVAPRCGISAAASVILV